MPDERGWKVVDPVSEEWPLRSSDAPLTLTCNGSLTTSCVLESWQLAAISSCIHGWERHRFDATECSSQGSALEREFDRSNTVASEWPESYHVLGEPSKYTMSTYTQIDDVSEDSDASTSRQNWSRASSLDVRLPAACSLPEFSCKIGQTEKFGPKIHSIKNIPLCSGPCSGTVDSGEEQVMLRVSQPAQLIGYPGCYAVRLVRASLTLSFGLELFTAKTRHGKLNAIFVSDDLPFVGMRRWDRLLSINGWETMSIEECSNMVENRLSIVLVLQSKGKQPVESVPRHAMELLPPADQRLLTIKKEMLTKESEFMLMIRRRSPKQRLGLSFDASLTSNDRGEQVVTCDMLHLQVLAGDLLLSANGFRSPSKKVLCEILDTAIAIELIFKRDSSLSRLSPSEPISRQTKESDECLYAAENLVGSLLAVLPNASLDLGLSLRP